MVKQLCLKKYRYGLGIKTLFTIPNIDEIRTYINFCFDVVLMFKIVVNSNIEINVSKITSGLQITAAISAFGVVNI